MYVIVCSNCSSDVFLVFFFFFKQETAYEMRISDWSSDVCSSDLGVSCAEGEFAAVSSMDAVVRVRGVDTRPTGESPPLHQGRRGEVASTIERWTVFRE